MDFLFSKTISILIAIVVFTPAIVFHEIAHGAVANFCGDPTAKNRGRLSLNPLRHLDLLGVLAIVFFGFGWAKPVPVNPRNFRNEKWGTFLVAAAGPVANIIFAAIAAATANFLAGFDLTNFTFLASKILYSLVFANCVLAVFNLLPFPPLDGSKILQTFLPKNLSQKFVAAENSFAIGLLVAFGVERVLEIQILGPLIFFPAAKLAAFLFLVFG